MKKLRCALIGATGLAGQQFVLALKDHPWFELTGVAASPRSAGKTYLEALRAPNGMLGWFLAEPLPTSIASMTVQAGDALNPAAFDLVFSAVEADVAQQLEPLYAQHLPVISAASAFRTPDDVPLIIPPINAQHLSLIDTQRTRRGWKGFIAPIPNCTTTGLAITLAPLHAALGVDAVVMTSLQAVSGAGRSPGVVALDIIDNVIPHIAKEEAKVELETRKILGAPGLKLSATCTRVAVLEGHTEAAYVALKQKASIADIAQIMREWKGHPWSVDLPSAPPRWGRGERRSLSPATATRPRRPWGNGDVGRSAARRRRAAQRREVRVGVAQHQMGAAKGAVLLAELLHARGFLAESPRA
jgi:aspartate-semialdehyde dehydrogenase